MEVDHKYQATLLYLFSQFPQYQRIGSGAYKSGLEGMLALDGALGHPHQRFASIHIAGTNGKGSVSSMLAAVLQNAGYKVGLYTSPHLVDFRERIRINGAMIPKEEVVWFVDSYKPLLDDVCPSFFEITTAMAFYYFANQKVDIAVIETGLGGRLDSTNIINPILSVITNIGLDHCEYLGHTLPLIAAEKAGIIKAHTPVVIGERDPQTDSVFMNRAQELQAPIYFAQDRFKVTRTEQNGDHQQFCISDIEKNREEHYLSDLTGLYQQKNVSTLLQAVDLLPQAIGTETVKQGLKDVARLTGLRARWERIAIQPGIIVDAAHNAHGMRWIVEQLQKEQYRRLHFVLGVVVEKDLDSILPLLPQNATYYFTQAQIPRALDAHLLAEQCGRAGLVGRTIASVGEALTTAIQNANSDDLIFVGGSIFVAAEALERE
ncbi:MAG: bifunctional folylpolyglutamate synthase/dihydrofolate synthase [Bacteroidales bacterium]|nr:bifunctional folylpolyglutamate synthase/dihydrofolate synthase [Bacteroidales bacterium]